MPIQARRIFRLSWTTALALACGYALGEAMALPFIAPIFALMLTATPGPPLGPGKLLGLLVLVLVTLGTGLVLIPLLQHYPLSAVLIVAVGIYFSAYLTVDRGKGLVGAFLTMGFTMISAAGTVDFSLATTVIESLCLGIVIAVACHWLVYPWFPEDAVVAPAPAAAEAGAAQSNGIALRATLIVLPVYLLALTNPGLYMPLIMKSVSIGQQASLGDARQAGRSLLGSTFLGGSLAVLFWGLLGLEPNLWMFFWWTLAFVLFFSSKLYGLLPSRRDAPFWLDVAVTLFILLGPAVQDSDNGKDVFMAFCVRMSLFVGLALYATQAMRLLESLGHHHRSAPPLTTPN